MKILRRKITLFFIIFFAFFMMGCQDVEDFKYKQVDFNIEKNKNNDSFQISTGILDRKVKDFIMCHLTENGIYILDEDENLYILLNGINHNPDNEILNFKDFKIESTEDSLKIKFAEEKVKDLVDDNKKVQKILLYKVTKLQEFEYLKVYRNGEETFFNSIDG